MFSRRSGGWLVALFFSAVATSAVAFAGCSAKTYTDINFGSGLGDAFAPPDVLPDVLDAGADADGGDTADVPASTPVDADTTPADSAPTDAAAGDVD